MTARVFKAVKADQSRGLCSPGQLFLKDTTAPSGCWLAAHTAHPGDCRSHTLTIRNATEVSSSPAGGMEAAGKGCKPRTPQTLTFWKHLLKAKDCSLRQLLKADHMHANFSKLHIHEHPTPAFTQT